MLGSLGAVIKSVARTALLGERWRRAGVKAQAEKRVYIEHLSCNLSSRLAGKQNVVFRRLMCQHIGCPLSILDVYISKALLQVL